MACPASPLSSGGEDAAALIALPATPAADGDPATTKWVLVVNLNPGAIAGGSGGQYFVGDFDGTRFTADDAGPYTPPPGDILADFEGPDYGDWTTTGMAFGTGPARGTLPGQQAVSGFRGGGLVDSFIDFDGAQGTLTSPEFTLSRDSVNFLVGGGAHAPRSRYRTSPACMPHR
jgi:fructan beta-fructosidase